MELAAMDVKVVGLLLGLSLCFGNIQAQKKALHLRHVVDAAGLVKYAPSKAFLLSSAPARHVEAQARQYQTPVPAVVDRGVSKNHRR